MRNSTVFYWQFEKQQILCLPSHQNGERQHWKSPLQCLSEPWPWECASTTGKGATCGQQGPPFLSPECQMFDSWCCGGICSYQCAHTRCAQPWRGACERSQRELCAHQQGWAGLGTSEHLCAHTTGTLEVASSSTICNTEQYLLQ